MEHKHSWRYYPNKEQRKCRHCSYLEPYKPRQEPPPFTREDLNDMIDRAENSRNKCLVALCHLTAGRINEVLPTRKSDITIDDDGYYVVNMLNEKNRESKVKAVPINPSDPLFQHVKGQLDQLGEEDYLFPSWSHPRPDKPYLTRGAAYKIVKRLNPDAFPHWFRHSRTTEVIVKRGFTPWDVKQLRGDTDLRAQEPYTHLAYHDYKRKL